MTERILIILTFLFATGASAETRVILMDGTAAPDGLGVFDANLGDVVSLSGDGIAISTRVTGPPAKSVVLVGNTSGDLHVVAKTSDILPNTNVLDTLTNVSGPVLNATGHVAFPAVSYLSGSPNSGCREMLVGSINGIDAQPIGCTNAVPGGDGLFYQRTSLAPAINNSGMVAFSGSLYETSGGDLDNEAIYRFDPGTGNVIEIVRKGDAAPNAGTYTGTVFQASEAFASPFISSDGRVAFVAEINGGVFEDHGLFVSDGTVTSTYFRYLQPLPGGGQYGSTLGYQFNRQGQVASVVDWASTSNSAEGVYRSDGNTIVSIAVSGQTAPSGFPFRVVYGPVKQDAFGKSVFGASITADTGILDGIYAGDGDTTTQLALEGNPAPLGRGNYTRMQRFTISDGGYIAFSAIVDNSITAVYRENAGQIEELVSTLESIDGSQIVTLELAGFDYGQSVGINDAGEVAFKFELDDGRMGVALAGAAPLPDSDSDGIADNLDNCTTVANPDQRDTNQDGFGNICDPDLNNDGTTNFLDLSLLQAAFFGNDPDADFDGDNVVNFVDLAVMRARFFTAPGPSGVAQ